MTMHTAANPEYDPEEAHRWAEEAIKNPPPDTVDSDDESILDQPLINKPLLPHHILKQKIRPQCLLLGLICLHLLYQKYCTDNYSDNYEIRCWSSQTNINNNQSYQRELNSCHTQSDYIPFISQQECYPRYLLDHSLWSFAHPHHWQHIWCMVWSLTLGGWMWSSLRVG